MATLAAKPTTTVRRRVTDHGGYIGGLDGLRALAVAAVVIYHVSPGFLPGGFLGVDIFFVVSGFLITTLLIRELRSSGRISLAGFWTRRARRLLPALLLLVVTIVPVAALAGRDLLVGIGRQVAGALTFSSNWLEIARGSSYFDSTSPLLFKNFWSLAVEEQFYLFWPLLFLILIALVRTWKTRIALVLGVGAVSAVLMGVLAGAGDNTRVYYGTDTHLFGLAIGVALAFAWASPSDTFLQTERWSRFHLAAGIGSVGGLLLLMASLSDQSVLTYRGGILLAAILTAVVIASMITPGSILARAGEDPVTRWIGTRSYGLYLWHWPILVIVHELIATAEGTPAHTGVSLLAVVLTGIICEASYRYVETPVRRHGFRDTATMVRASLSLRTRPAIALAAVVTLLTGATAVAIVTAPEKSSVTASIEEGEARIAAEAQSPAPSEPEVVDFDGSMPDGDEITAIGDSIIVTSMDGLDARFPGINYIAKSNRQWHEAPDLVREGLASQTIRRAVILDFGTNAGVTDPDVVRETIDLLGPRLILLVNIYSPSTFVEGSNATLTEIAEEYPNVYLMDWHEAVSQNPGMLQSDNTHPDLEGMHLFAQVAYETFEKAAGGAEPAEAESAAE